jgi:hypothetical protein
MRIPMVFAVTHRIPLLVVLLMLGACSAQARIFPPLPVLYETVATPGTITTGDFNGDGIQDFIVGGWQSDSMSTFTAAGGGSFTRLDQWGYTRRAAMINLNGDADPDLVSLSAPTLTFFTGNGTGAFEWLSEVNLNGTAYTDPYEDFAVGDFNGDGFSDFALTEYHCPGSVAVLLSKGDGTYWPQVDYPTLPGPFRIVAVDVNTDSRLDLVIPTPGNCLQDQNAVSVMLGNADGTFAPRQDFGTAECPLSVTVNDFNGDSKADLAISTCLGIVSVLFGAGDGTFGVNNDYVVSTQQAHSLEDVVSADFDGDQSVDLAVLDSDFNSPSSVVILRNNGAGVFADSTRYAVGYRPEDLAVLDLNGDQEPDLLAASPGSFPYEFGSGVYGLVNCSPCTPTAIEIVLLDASATATGIQIRWRIHEPDGTRAVLERRTSSDDWRNLAEMVLTGTSLEYEDRDVLPGLRYAYRLVLHTSEGILITPEIWMDAPGTIRPHAVTLAEPLPNPSGGQIRIHFGLPRDSHADLVVFDVSGRLVTRISAAERSAGWHDLTWDGRDRNGRPVGSGTYFLRLSAGTSVSRRFVVLR